MSNENVVSSRDLTREYGLGHADIVRNTRTLIDEGLIKTVILSRYQNPQNKKFYDMFLFKDIDINWLIGRLINMPEKYPVGSISKELNSYVLELFRGKCFKCEATTDLYITKIEKAGRICARNLMVACDDCLGSDIEV